MIAHITITCLLWLWSWATPPVSYKLLLKEVGRGIEGVGYGYAVSVEQCPDEEALKRLICQIVVKENPAGYSRLTIGVHHQLDEYSTLFQNEALTKHYLEHQIAIYVWVDNLMGKRVARLIIVRDSNCARYQGGDRRVSFDHSVECQKPPGACSAGSASRDGSTRQAPAWPDTRSVGPR